MNGDKYIKRSATSSLFLWSGYTSIITVYIYIFVLELTVIV